MKLAGRDVGFWQSRPVPDLPAEDEEGIKAPEGVTE